jgi:NUMOD4 motif
MRERWVKLPEFPLYSVSDLGRVRNDERRTMVAQHQMKSPGLCVNLYKDRLQYSRSVARLVLMLFEGPHENAMFDTPVNLDGDRSNNALDNLVWRPRWFAIKYHQQFEGRLIDEYVVTDLTTGEVFDYAWDVVRKYGVLYGDLLWNQTQDGTAWPSGHIFEVKPKTLW